MHTIFSVCGASAGRVMTSPIKRVGERPGPQVFQEEICRVVEVVGHSRVTKVNAYLSTFAKQERLQRKLPTVEEVREALRIAEGNKSRAATALGISRQALYRILGAAAGNEP
ncbi:DNA-binding NtrC family response regulator [Paraburkholderia youngii]